MAKEVHISPTLMHEAGIGSPQTRIGQSAGLASACAHVARESRGCLLRDCLWARAGTRCEFMPGQLAEMESKRGSRPHAPEIESLDVSEVVAVVALNLNNRRAF